MAHMSKPISEPASALLVFRLSQNWNGSAVMNKLRRTPSNTLEDSCTHQFMKCLEANASGLLLEEVILLTLDASYTVKGMWVGWGSWTDHILSEQSFFDRSLNSGE